MKVASRVALIRKLAGTTWGADAATLRISVLALVFSTAEYCAPVWCRSSHTHLLDSELNRAMHIITGCLKNTPTPMLYVLANVAPPSIRRDALVLKSAWKALADPASLLHAVIAVPAMSYRQLQPPTRKSARLNLAPVLVVEQRLTSRKPFQWAAQTLLANSGEVFPVSANQRKTLADIFVLDSWKRSWHESCAWRDYFPTPSLDPLKGTMCRTAWSRFNRLLSGRTRLAADMLSRVVVSVSSFRSWDGLETYFSSVSVSSRSRGIVWWSWSRSRLGLKTKCLGLVSGLVPEGLVYKRIFWSFLKIYNSFIFIDTCFVSCLFKRRTTQSTMWHNINNDNYCSQLITLSSKIEKISPESYRLPHIELTLRIWDVSLSPVILVKLSFFKCATSMCTRKSCGYPCRRCQPYETPHVLVYTWSAESDLQ